MQTTEPQTRRNERWQEQQRREDELAALSAHLSAATARWLELAWEFHEESGDLAGFLAWRCGITRREAREYLRVAEALQELPVTQAVFSRGERTFTKVRALAAPSPEEGLRARSRPNGLAARPRVARVPSGCTGRRPQDARARVRGLPLRGRRLAVPTRARCL